MKGTESHRGKAFGVGKDSNAAFRRNQFSELDFREPNHVRYQNTGYDGRRGADRQKVA